MRKLAITQNIMLDGSIEQIDDWFDPQLKDDELLEESHREEQQCDALLLGRRSPARQSMSSSLSPATSLARNPAATP